MGNIIKIHVKSTLHRESFCDIKIHNLTLTHDDNAVALSCIQQLHCRIAHFAGNHTIPQSRGTPRCT